MPTSAILTSGNLVMTDSAPHVKCPYLGLGCVREGNIVVLTRPRTPPRPPRDHEKPRPQSCQYSLVVSWRSQSVLSASDSGSAPKKSLVLSSHSVLDPFRGTGARTRVGVDITEPPFPPRLKVPVRVLALATRPLVSPSTAGPVGCEYLVRHQMET
jgi:hypothetical protein